MRGTVTGTQPGDSVKVLFEGGGATSPSFTDAAETESSNRVLVLAAEDYSGASTFPARLSARAAALLPVVVRGRPQGERGRLRRLRRRCARPQGSGRPRS